MVTVVAGSYERFVFGYNVGNLPGGGGGASDGPPSVTRSFTLDAHLTQCKSVAAQSGFIASGGADDLIRVWHHNPDGAVADLGTLSGHEGTVSCLAFHGPSVAAEPTRMVSGGVDGGLIIWSVVNWDVLKKLRAHRGGVHALSIHKSGKVAMTAGADSHVAMWNMQKGRVAHKTKLRQKPELLAFTPSGLSYAVVTQQKLTITSAETGAVVGVFDAPKRVMCMAQAGSDQMAYLGCEGGDVVAYDARAPPTKPALTIVGAHPARVKVLCAPSDDPDGGVPQGGPGGGPTSLVSASSDGVVKLWDLRLASSGAATARGLGVENARDTPVASASGGGRFTCMATMPTALPPKVAAAVLAEGAAGRAREGREAQAAAKAKRKEEKKNRVEKARLNSARRPPDTPGKDKGNRGGDGDENFEKPSYDYVDFEVVADEETVEEEYAPRRVEKPEKKKNISSDKNEDETLVPKKAKFNASEGKRGGKSYEETATAARRKGSGAARSKPSRGFRKPSRG